MHKMTIDVFLLVMACILLAFLLLTLGLVLENLWRIYPIVEGKIVRVTIMETRVARYKYILDFEYEKDMKVRCARVYDDIHTKRSNISKYQVGDMIIVHQNPITGGFRSKEYVDTVISDTAGLATAIFGTIASVLLISDMKEWAAIKNTNVILVGSGLVTLNVLNKICAVLGGRYLVLAFSKIINNIRFRRMIDSTKYETVIGKHIGYNVYMINKNKRWIEGKFHYYRYEWRGISSVVTRNLLEIDDQIMDNTIYVNPTNHVAEMNNWSSKENEKNIRHIIIGCVCIGISLILSMG